MFIFRAYHCVCVLKKQNEFNWSVRFTGYKFISILSQAPHQ